MPRAIAQAIFVLSLVLVNASLALSEIRVGVLALRGEQTAQNTLEPLAQYLTDRMGEKVSVIPLPFDKVNKFCESKEGEFILANSWWFVRTKVKFGAEALVTAEDQEGGLMFGGVIFATKKSGIRSIDDIRNKTVICPKFSSAGGWIFQKGVLVRHGLVPEQDCKSLQEAGTHDKAVYAVRDGKAEVGMVRTGILEQMQREQKINIDDFVIINKSTVPQQTVLCSTELYPDWPLAVLPHTSSSVKNRMKEALLKAPEDHTALKTMRVKRFLEPLDYGPVEELLAYLKVEPFNRGGTVSQSVPVGRSTAQNIGR